MGATEHPLTLTKVSVRGLSYHLEFVCGQEGWADTV